MRWPGDGPPLIDPAWRTDVVLRLASGIQRSGDFSALPILADALEEAGCDSLFVLNHCRLCPVHEPGCWVVSAVLRTPALSHPPEPMLTSEQTLRLRRVVAAAVNRPSVRFGQRVRKALDSMLGWVVVLVLVLAAVVVTLSIAGVLHIH
jgi:hypothetical protein